jgi:hypothetical protein
MAGFRAYNGVFGARNRGLRIGFGNKRRTVGGRPGYLAKKIRDPQEIPRWPK